MEKVISDDNIATVKLQCGFNYWGFGNQVSMITCWKVGRIKETNVTGLLDSPQEMEDCYQMLVEGNFNLHEIRTFLESLPQIRP